MAQKYAQKAVNNFVKGLITEAGELTFPESASVDELNCDLRRDGSRRRRLAVEKESNWQTGTFSITNHYAVSSGDWKNAAGVAGKNFLVVQSGQSLYFYDKGEFPYSAAQQAFSIDLTTYAAQGIYSALHVKCQYASINGYLVVTSSDLDAFYVKYNAGLNTISHAKIDPFIRDFEWQGDTSTYYTAMSITDNDRIYDAKNCGWSQTNAPTYTNKPLTHPWYAGKDADGNYSSTEFDKVYSGNTLTANGHYILKFFYKDRFSIGPEQTVEIETSRFQTVAAFAGRVFYAGLNSQKNGSSILFTKVIEEETDFNKCYQVNDPTAEYLSDLLDTDGGVIKIPEAVNIKLLYAFKTSLFVFAENGVWSINGVDGVFRASEYSVNKITDVGIASPWSFVSVEGQPMWWSQYGIHLMGFDQVSGNAGEQNLSLPTIQSFWDDIDPTVKEGVTAAYDSINKKVFWFYPDYTEGLVQTKLNNVLILDVALQAFYPWRIEDDGADTASSNWVVGAAFYTGYGSADLELNVVSNGDNVISNTNNVISTEPRRYSSGDAAITLLVRDQATGNLTMAGFTGTDFLDWGTAEYSSFAEVGYDFVGDLVAKKNAPYIVVYTRLTEEGFQLTGGQYEPIRPSSILVSSAWDFHEHLSTPQQGYRLKFPVVVDPENPSNFNYPEDVITTRLKMRGHGRSVRLRFESEGSNDFILLGWGLIQASNGRY